MGMPNPDDEFEVNNLWMMYTSLNILPDLPIAAGSPQCMNTSRVSCTHKRRTSLTSQVESPKKEGGDKHSTVTMVSVCKNTGKARAD